MIEVKKGESVILKGFTGIKLGVFQVTVATKKTVTITKRNGDEMVFDRKTGKQINVEEGKEKYANSIMEDDGSYVAPSTRGAAKKSAPKKATKAPVVEEDDEDEDEEEEEPKPAKKTAKKPAAKAPAKKPSKKAPVVEDDEDDEDDDDFEEIDD